MYFWESDSQSYMVPRIAETTLKNLASQFRAVALVGPRQSGKSTLAKTAFPNKEYVSLENPEIMQSALDDPKGFLKRFEQGAIIDEAQRVPELFNYLQQILDESNERGKFILSGSNNFLMLEKITRAWLVVLDTLIYSLLVIRSYLRNQLQKP
ncbi:MAG: AAA family ATPase [Cyclobacteriaceae bacterium]|nr:AAA family ATPase [Cyclobacteriaceae bacterium]